jgi:hypothetical protein
MPSRMMEVEVRTPGVKHTVPMRTVQPWLNGTARCDTTSSDARRSSERTARAQIGFTDFPSKCIIPQKVASGLPTNRELSRQPTPERDFIEISQGCAQSQLFAHRHFPPQFVEEVQQESHVAGYVTDCDPLPAHDVFCIALILVADVFDQVAGRI